MSSIQSRIDDLGQQFSACKGWEEKYGLIIRLGKSLPTMDDTVKIDKYLVRGCQSAVWLHAHLNEQGQVVLQADSDALIVRGLVAILLQIYSGSPPQEILAHPPEFLAKWGFEQNLSPSRTNGLHAMVKQIMLYAAAFKALAR